jgi:hypothetical protein
MSKPEIVTTKEIDVKRGGGEPTKSVQEEILERREAIEQIRKDREKPREEWQRTGKGASEQVELISNRETRERYANQDGAPVSTEDLTESAREKWLRTGDLPEKKANGKAKETVAEKPPERPKLADYRNAEGQVDNERYEAALDRYEAEKTAFAERQAAKPNEGAVADLDRETFEEFKTERQDFWNESEHAEAHRTFPDRVVRVIQALTPAEKQVLTNSPVSKMKLHGDLDGYLGHALSRVKNLGRVLVVLNKDVPLMERINADYAKTEGNPQKRFESQQMIRYVLKYIDKQVAKMSDTQWHGSGSNGAERKLTRAGRPPLEPSGGMSSPADDGSAEAAWKRKDLSAEAKGELYRERKNAEETAARRKRYGRR